MLKQSPTDMLRSAVRQVSFTGCRQHPLWNDVLLVYCMPALLTDPLECSTGAMLSPRPVLRASLPVHAAYAQLYLREPLCSASQVPLRLLQGASLCPGCASELALRRAEPCCERAAPLALLL